MPPDVIPPVWAVDVFADVVAVVDPNRDAEEAGAVPIDGVDEVFPKIPPLPPPPAWLLLPTMPPPPVPLVPPNTAGAGAALVFPNKPPAGFGVFASPNRPDVAGWLAGVAPGVPNEKDRFCAEAAPKRPPVAGAVDVVGGLGVPLEPVFPNVKDIASNVDGSRWRWVVGGKAARSCGI